MVPTGLARGARRAGLARGARRAARGDRGQSTVELMVLLPLVVALVFAAFTLLAARSAAGEATAAAQAGAMAMLQDGNPRAAARASLPKAVRSRATIVVRGRSVRVTVRPSGPVPSVARSLSASSVAHAGPEPRR